MCLTFGNRAQTAVRVYGISSGSGSVLFCFQHLDSSRRYMRQHLTTASSHNTRNSRS